MVGLNKADLGNSEDGRASVQEIAEELSMPVFVFSAFSGEGVDELLHGMADAVARAAQPVEEG